MVERSCDNRVTDRVGKDSGHSGRGLFQKRAFVAWARASEKKFGQDFTMKNSGFWPVWVANALFSPQRNAKLSAIVGRVMSNLCYFFFPIQPTTHT